MKFEVVVEYVECRIIRRKGSIQTQDQTSKRKYEKNIYTATASQQISDKNSKSK